MILSFVKKIYFLIFFSCLLNFKVKKNQKSKKNFYLKNFKKNLQKKISNKSFFSIFYFFFTLKFNKQLKKKLKNIIFDKTQNHDLFISPKRKNAILKMSLQSSTMSKLDHQMSKN